MGHLDWLEDEAQGSTPCPTPILGQGSPVARPRDATPRHVDRRHHTRRRHGWTRSQPPVRRERNAATADTRRPRAAVPPAGRARPGRRAARVSRGRDRRAPAGGAEPRGRDPRGTREHGQPRGRQGRGAHGRLGVVGRECVAGRPLRAARSAPGPRLRRRRPLDSCARHRRQHGHLQRHRRGVLPPIALPPAGPARARAGRGCAAQSAGPRAGGSHDDLDDASEDPSRAGRPRRARRAVLRERRARDRKPESRHRTGAAARGRDVRHVIVLHRVRPRTGARPCVHDGGGGAQRSERGRALAPPVAEPVRRRHGDRRPARDARRSAIRSGRRHAGRFPLSGCRPGVDPAAAPGADVRDVGVPQLPARADRRASRARHDGGVGCRAPGRAATSVSHESGEPAACRSLERPRHAAAALS